MPLRRLAGPLAIALLAAGCSPAGAPGALGAPPHLAAPPPVLQTSPGPSPAVSPRAVPANQSAAPPDAPLPDAPLVVPAGRGATISLTFDDGPGLFSGQVLALLARYHVPAVFCLIGIQAVRHPELVRAEAAAGHRLCDHSRDHDEQMSALGAAYVRAEVHDGLADIRQADPQVPVPFYRQPGGTWTPLVQAAVAAEQLRELHWTVDPRDWSRPGTEVIERRVLAGLRPGAVVLLHDGGGERSQTVAALAWLLPRLAAAGWRFTAPS